MFPPKTTEREPRSTHTHTRAREMAMTMDDDERVPPAITTPTTTTATPTMMMDGQSESDAPESASSVGHDANDASVEVSVNDEGNNNGGSMANSNSNADADADAATGTSATMTMASSSSPSPPQRASRRVAAAAAAMAALSTSPVLDIAPSSSTTGTAAVQQTASVAISNAGATSASASKTTTATVTSTAAALAPRIVVARPPLNAYLKIAIIRDTTDAVVCEDPEHPGKKKRIVMTQLSTLDVTNNSTNSNKEAAISSTADVVKKEEKEMNENNNSNKKEIPVPTITTVKRYDRDVPPNYHIPTCYIRNICPTYTEVMNETVEYNIDAEDEYWWRENRLFGPFAKAKIILTGEEEEEEQVQVNENDVNGEVPLSELGNNPTTIDDKSIVDDSNKMSDATIAADQGGTSSSITKPEKYGRKRMRKSSSIKSSKSNSSSSSSYMMFLDDNNITDNSMEIEQTNSDVSAPLPPPPAPLSSTNTSHPNHPRQESMTIEQALLLNPKYLYSQHSTRTLLQRYNPKLPLPIFEKMMDTLEKATGFESIMTNSQAEQILIKKIPQLIEIFGPLSAKERRREEEMEELFVSRWLKNKHHTATETSSSSSSQPKYPYPVIAPPVTLPTVIHQVYTYWVAKRSKLRKPLLRRYWPPTSASDQNPHQVFRQRDKEKRRLRKKRQNDIEAYKKMKQLKLDFERVGVLCELIVQRETVNRNLVELTQEYFEERWYGWTDTSGVPRQQRLQDNDITNTTTWNRGMIAENILQNVPKYFEDGPILRLRGGKKRHHRPLTQVNGGMWNADGRDLSPIPPSSCAVSSTGVALPPIPLPNNLAMSSSSFSMLPPQGIKPTPLLAGGVVVPPPPLTNIVVAGHDGGYPAPNFLQPLASRDSHPITNWDDAVPSIPSYVNGELTTQTDKFRHRPRLGRGGRIIIDRVPCPASDYSDDGIGHGSINTSLLPPAPTVITYGSPMKRSGYDIGTLGADGPNYTVDSIPNNSIQFYDAKSAPKAPPAKCLADLLPKSLGDTIALSRRIEEICALGLMEDYQNQLGSSTSSSASAAGAAAISVSNNGNTASSSAGAGAAASATLSVEMDEILVPIEDWMEAPEALNLYGSEQFVIGPL
ncbi:hypothetical protein ACHAXH_009401 [Discostella pseudostelligera]